MGEQLHAKHRQRMRDKLNLHGGAAFNDHELLEMLLYNAIPRQNTNPLAHKLINAFGSLEKVINAPTEALMHVEGVGENTASYIKLLSEVNKRIQNTLSDTPAQIMDSEKAMEIILPEFENLKEEKVFLLAMDKYASVCYKGFINIGNNDTVDYRAREIMNKCVPVKACMYYLAHNHPSGIATPSRTDLRNSVITENILTPMNMLMLDHFVIADGDYVSFKDSKMLLRQLSMPEILEIISGN